MAFNKTMAAAFAAPAITPAQRKDEPGNPGLTFTERGVLTMLCNMADKRTSKLFPKHATIAGRLGISRATVVRTLAVLESLGWVERAGRRRRDGSRTSDLITIMAPAVVRVPDRLLPLMSVVSSTKVTPCDSVKVAPCDNAPPDQSRTVQQHIPTTKNLSLEIAGGRPPVEKKPARPSETQEQMAKRLMAAADANGHGEIPPRLRRRVA